MATVIPTANHLRVRSAPNLQGEILTLVNTWDQLETADASQVGQRGAWLAVRLPDGRSGYAAAWYLQPYVAGANITGVNLDVYNGSGRPAAADLGNLGWVRLKFNVSYNPDDGSYGNLDVGAAYNRHAPYFEAYRQAGQQVLVVLTHQLYGEGHYVWGQHNWDEFIPRYADFARQTAQHFAGKDLVQVYQIWNEQDTDPANARAAVPVPAADYANLLTQTIQAIRSVDSTAQIITGGHVTGGGPGSAYATATLAAMPDNVRPDGIAFHPYGLGPTWSPYSIYGQLGPTLKLFRQVLPDKPVWITEWGVLDRQEYDETERVALYAQSVLGEIQSRYAGQVAAAIWYAWAKGMDNGYGLVGWDGQPLDPLYGVLAA